ncbi:hypothetical protein FOA52_003678 [Chlamydomonas sp. UWO 241]|nr:hypothetical protein FOA52_003678 [Chlamydomonas sp. UWO 241]
MCGPLPSPWTSSIASTAGTLLGSTCAQTLGLIALKDAVTLASWPSLSGWTTSTEPCPATWTGVSCAGTTVTALDLGFVNMEGTLPAALSKVTGLTSLNLGGNKLTGSLPLAWSVLTGLTVVDVSKNLLSSSLPVAWQTLASLQRMDLSDNALTSTVPMVWMSGTPHMAAMARLTANNNVNMCGSFAATAWASVHGMFLGDANRFFVLAGAAVTSMGVSVIQGLLGVFPGVSVTGPLIVVQDGGTAAAFQSAAVSAAAIASLTTAILDAQSRTPCAHGSSILTTAELGGRTLYPGLYKSTVGNVFWQVGTSGTLGAGSVLEGTMLADQSVTSGINAVVHGRVLARIAAVTMMFAEYLLTG